MLRSAIRGCQELTLRLVLGATLALTACAGLITAPEAPRLALAGMRGIELGARDARLLLQFDAFNPNRAPIEVQAIEFDVALEGITIATGRTERAFVLPPERSSMIDVDVTTSLDRLAAASRAAVARAGTGVRYELTGHAIVAGREVPFRRSGETPLPTPRALRLR